MNNERNIAVVGGTNFDAALGQKWLARKGVATTAIGMSQHPKEQAQLYLQPEKLKAVFHEKVGSKSFEKIIIYCNSLSFATDWRSIYGARITELSAQYLPLWQQLPLEKTATIVAEENTKLKMLALAYDAHPNVTLHIFAKLNLILALENSPVEEHFQLIENEIEALKSKGFENIVFGCTHLDHPEFYKRKDVNILQPGLELIDRL